MAIIKIEIPRRSHTCFEGKEPFDHGMDYFSLLVEGGDKGYERRDFCPECWNKEEHEGIYWKSKVPEKQNMKQEEKFQNRNAKSLHLLHEALREENNEEAFILALFLLRFKVLAHRQDLEEGITLYEVLATEEMLSVPKVELSTIQTATLQAELAEKLKNG